MATQNAEHISEKSTYRVHFSNKKTRSNNDNLKYNLLERSIEYILHRTDNIIATAQRMLDATELLHPASQNPAKAS